MTNREILQKALEQAQKNGFKLSNQKHAIAIENDVFGRPTDHIIGYESIIYDHDFAKAFFGEDKPEICWSCLRHHDSFNDCDAGTGNDTKFWEFHLALMVLEKNPIKYLKKFII